MAQIAPITLNNGVTPTPVAKTFNPISSDNLIARWQDRSGGIIVGMPELNISLSVASTDSAMSRVKFAVKLPVMEVISNNTNSGYAPLPKIAYTCHFKGEFTLPARATTAQRADLLAFVRNYVATQVVADAVLNYERPFG